MGGISERDFTRGERGMQAEMFVRHLLSAGAPFVTGEETLNDSPSDVLARAAGGILFVPDLMRLARSEQKNLEFLLARSEKHKARIVSFSRPARSGGSLVVMNSSDRSMPADASARPIPRSLRYMVAVSICR